MSDQPTNTPGSGGNQMKNPFQGLNVDKVKTAGLPIQLMLGGSIVFFIFGFFDWYSVSYSAGGFGSASWSGNAFEYFPGTLAWILMLAVGIVALLTLAGALAQYRQQVVFGLLGGSALSVILVIWYWAASAGKDIPDVPGLDSGASFGLYICLIAAIAATAGAVLNYQAFAKGQQPGAASVG